MSAAMSAALHLIAVAEPLRPGLGVRTKLPVAPTYLSLSQPLQPSITAEPAPT